LLVGLVALDELILLEGEEQVEERLWRDAEAPHRPGERDHHRVARPAVVSPEQFTPPPAQ
jgi:hypothetical protein